MTIGTEIILIVLLVLLNGVLAMSEIAFVSARQIRLRQRAERGDRGARAALELAAAPGRLLSTVQVGITLVGILAGAFGGATLAEELAQSMGRLQPLAPYSEALGLAVVVIGLSYLSLVLGELVPKQLALIAPERLAALVARPLTVLAKVATPAVFLLDGSSRFLLRLFGARRSNEPPITEEELKQLLVQGTLAGVFEKGEQEIVARVVRLGESRVGELVTPRRDVVALDVNAPLAESWSKIEGNEHFYFPVFDGTLDRVLGVVSIKDLWRRDRAGETPDLRSLLSEPVYLPEGASVLQALERMREAGIHMALVLDEFGGIEGLVTLHDVLQAIVGDLPTLKEEALAVRREDGSWLFDGMMPLSELSQILELPTGAYEELEEYRTMGGFVMGQLGRVPQMSEGFLWHGFRFEVVDMDQLRVDKVLVVPPRAHDIH